MTWENTGFSRNEEGEVTLYWECTECGYEVEGGMEPPEYECPNCKTEGE